jgi:hypothetical protein
MRITSLHVACLALTTVGCVELQYAAAPIDRPEVTDASDAAIAMDARDVRDVPDVRDLPDVRDVPDVPDVPVVMDVRDVPDVPVVMDVRDVPDAPVVMDVRDVPDAPDAPDAPDVPDVPDVTDVRDVPVVPDVPRDVPVDMPVVFEPTVVTLQSATASFSQPMYEVTHAIDSNPAGGQGWGIAPPGVGAVSEESAVFEFMATTPASPSGTRVVITMVNNVAGFRLASFRFSLTTAARDQFANGLVSGGNLGLPGIWATPLTFVSAAATNGVTIAHDAGAFLTSTGLTASTYTITLDVAASQLTGLRLDAIRNSAIPGGGPGNGTGNNPGNFIVSDLQVSVSRRP